MTSTNEEMNRFKISKRVTPFTNTYFTEKWEIGRAHV